MATLEILHTKVDGVVTAIGNISQDIQGLKDKIASGANITQADLDALDSKLSGALTQAQDVDASVPCRRPSAVNSEILIAIHGQFLFYETDHESIRIALPAQHWGYSSRDEGSGRDSGVFDAWGAA